MSDFSSFTHSFILDKQHFTECFEQTHKDEPVAKAYFKALVLLAFGIVVVLFTDINEYTAWFVFALGVLEALSVRFQKPWWVARQMLSKASNAEVTLTIDQKGITTQSFYNETNVAWQDVTQLEEAELGWIVHQGKNRSYIAKKGFTDELNQFLAQKSAQLS